ncbi:hypothetical protein DV096_10440 [Bradymonadaceae bacterium TMQ3]|uniref:Outer membrane protein beta-barrel domain-containing protein n=1 Tax=Lujinxingia sediminis TaxID=2480984 RepID=A0ABY0CS14_9DELT|nr:hypothetical protein [Lujinxingia sediminis]RDV38223.1 hypothetical protein DV096_10440 [Bradymonadaceae bacterium TMQ3]RVU43578.1 hypothetical protein EA187_12185 [Lujinxingia sediminis]TXC75893.1 hypothetical protein FRC91_10345 [Bradymonadales bacterium TMQ1]
MSLRHAVAASLMLGLSLAAGEAQAGEPERPASELTQSSSANDQEGAEEGMGSEGQRARLFGLGVFTRGGMAAYRSMGCACIDRKTWRAGLGARLHVGPYLAAEIGVTVGMMMLGGNFPLNGWEVAARWQPAPHADARAVAGLYTRLGYTSMQVMGMRSVGAPGVSAALGWSMQLVPMLSLEVEAGAQRHFGAMAHWQLGGQLGLATRF